MSKASFRITTIFVAALLGACSVAPGMKMTEPAEVPGGEVVRVAEITTDLLRSIDQTREENVRQITKEFAVEKAQYLIGPGDVIQVIVWDHPELTIPAGSFRDSGS